MKKNFLFKGVSVLGAILLLANVVLPGLQVYAESEEDESTVTTVECTTTTGAGEDAPSTSNGNNVAQIGKTCYSSLDDAIKDAGDDVTITLLKDVEVDSSMEVKSSRLTLDMNSKKITSTKNNIFVINSNKKLTITGSGRIEGPTIVDDLHEKVLISVDGGTLEIVNGTLTAKGDSGKGMYGVYILNGGTAIFGDKEASTGPSITSYFAAVATNNTTAPATVTIYGGTYKATVKTEESRDWEHAAIYAPANGTYTINGGTFDGKYLISSPYSNVDQTITIGNITTSTEGKNPIIFIGDKQGVTQDSKRTVESRSDNLGLNDGHIWVKDVDVYKVGYNVTFNTNGGTAVNGQQVVENGKIEEPTVPSKTNYTFGGWYKEDSLTNEWNFGTDTVTGATTLYAKWLNNYTVIFKNNGSEIQGYAQTVAEGEKATQPENPTTTESGKTFKWWSKSENNDNSEYNFNTAVTGNLTLNAVFDDIVTVNFMSGEVSLSTAKIAKGTKVTAPEDPKMEGYAFDKWQTCRDFTGGASTCTDFDFDTAIEEDTTLYATWLSTEWEMYAIHANPVTKSSNDSSNTTCTELDGGQCKENVADGTYITADGKYTILSSDKGHTLTYSNITLKDPRQGTDGTATAGRPAGYIWFGVRFIHPASNNTSASIKYTDGDTNFYNSSANYTDRWGQRLNSGDIQTLVSAGTFTKEWTYSVSWNGEKDQAEEYKVVADLSNIKVLNESDDDNGTVLIEVVNKEIKTLNGKEAYTITFNTDGGSAVASISANSGDKITVPANPTKDGYTFAGWDKTIPTEMPAENMTITAKWNQNSSSSRSSGGGGGGSSKSTTKTTTTTTGDTKTTTDTKTTDTKPDNNTTVDNNNKENNNDNYTPTYDPSFSQEFNDAYNFARKNNITTMGSIAEADMYGPLTRIAMAKMLSQYAINVLGKTPDTTRVTPIFPDVDEQLNADYNDGVKLAYQLGIMGINVENYRPFDLVTRAEFGTALSRMLYGLADGEGNEWYSTHLAKLMEEKIITVDTPNLQELRGYVMIMLMRSAETL